MVVDLNGYLEYFPTHALRTITYFNLACLIGFVHRLEYLDGYNSSGAFYSPGLNALVTAAHSREWSCSHGSRCVRIFCKQTSPVLCAAWGEQDLSRTILNDTFFSGVPSQGSVLRGTLFPDDMQNRFKHRGRCC